MAESKCIKCESIKFEIVNSFEKSIKFVQCANCGGVIGVLENIDFKNQFSTIIKNQIAIDMYVTNSVTTINNSLSNVIKEQELQNEDTRELIKKAYELTSNVGIAINAVNKNLITAHQDILKEVKK